jgi:hypothetical protein
MARGARLAYVGARQRKRGCAVVEYCARPGRGGVAGRALIREACLHMVRIRRAVVVREMTRYARRWQSLVHTT